MCVCVCVCVRERERERERETLIVQYTKATHRNCFHIRYTIHIATIGTLLLLLLHHRFSSLLFPLLNEKLIGALLAQFSASFLSLAFVNFQTSLLLGTSVSTTFMV